MVYLNTSPSIKYPLLHNAFKIFRTVFMKPVFLVP